MQWNYAAIYMFGGFLHPNFHRYCLNLFSRSYDFSCLEMMLLPLFSLIVTRHSYFWSIFMSPLFNWFSLVLRGTWKYTKPSWATTDVPSKATVTVLIWIPSHTDKCNYKDGCSLSSKHTQRNHVIFIGMLTELDFPLLWALVLSSQRVPLAWGLQRNLDYSNFNYPNTWLFELSIILTLCLVPTSLNNWDCIPTLQQNFDACLKWYM